MNNYKDMIKHIKQLRNLPLGCSDMALMIRLINENTPIVKELNEEKYKDSLLVFLDYGVRHLIDYEKEDSDVIYDTILYVLHTFRDLENKMEITSKEFVEMLKENYNK